VDGWILLGVEGNMILNIACSNLKKEVHIFCFESFAIFLFLLKGQKLTQQNNNFFSMQDLVTWKI
jgi:hypothetical protein